ncbi:hypothetical protein B296_00027255 [Ensete ventricosum]|uniref:Uncharacterized protein n=1 Tax=Ensete ventricosum TaxID=4639 RepID=A0A426YGE3_ENSVE|nr:hypothetical protein B296_00027255 [Ensete ventricosum]
MGRPPSRRLPTPRRRPRLPPLRRHSPRATQRGGPGRDPAARPRAARLRRAVPPTGGEGARQARLDRQGSRQICAPDPGAVGGGGRCRGCRFHRGSSGGNGSRVDGGFLGDRGGLVVGRRLVVEGFMDGSGVEEGMEEAKRGRGDGGEHRGIGGGKREGVQESGEHASGAS